MKHIKLTIERKLLLLFLIVKITSLSGQVPVHKEPRHHLLFENKSIRILNVVIPPGDTALYHIHSTPSLFIRLTDTNTGSQLKGGNPSTGRSVAGSVTFENLAPPNIRTHRVWNADKDTFNVIDIELLSADTIFDEKPLAMPNLQLAIDTSWVRSYRLTLPEGTEFDIRNRKQSLVVVSLDAATIQMKQDGKASNQTLKRASYFVIKEKQSFSIKNADNKGLPFVLVELP